MVLSKHSSLSIIYTDTLLHCNMTFPISQVLPIIALIITIISISQYAIAFSPSGRIKQTHNRYQTSTTPHQGISYDIISVLQATNDKEEEEDKDETEEDENPYADPNYPELEFVNYDDPEYKVDQGFGDNEVFDDEEDKTLVEIEAMREDRRKRNDEYQFETYHATVLRGGEVALGEWTVFQTDTFLGSDIIKGRNPEAAHVPRLLKWDKILKVVSRGSKVIIDPDAEWRVDGERIVHEERLATEDDFPALMMQEEVVDELQWESEDIEHVENVFWPKEMSSVDFRGPGGCMCVGSAYTICDAIPLLKKKEEEDDDDEHEGPFSEMRTELGIQQNGMRFRIKLDYALLEDEEEKSVVPPLHLRTLTICRETLDGYWPNPSDNEKVEEGAEKKSEVQRDNQKDITNALFGQAGAPGGLYDPPPVGTEERATDNYMLLDFEGGATVLLPHRLDQHDEDGETGEDANGYQRDDNGWVTSLDWTPGKIRYQVDRKVLSGKKLKGLRTLELSEVQGEEADRWRPKDGGENMRQ